MTATDPAVSGAFLVEDGVEWFRIDNVDHLDPFLINVVTPTDQWMFLSTSGALTAGRRSAQQALFPYETDDRLHRSGGRVGPVTLIRTPDGGLWEPFAPHVPAGTVERSVAKTSLGDRVRLEERHPGLGLTFRYTWASSDAYGFTRTCELMAEGSEIAVELVDGLVDLLPAGVDLGTQTFSSTLVDGYRRSQLDDSSGLALFTLEALVSDRAEPAESLRTTAAWVRGLPDPIITLSDGRLGSFRSGRPVEPQHLITGTKGSFLVATTAQVTPGSPVRWTIGVDTALDHGAIAELRRWLRTSADPLAEVAAAEAAAHRELLDLVAVADGLQETADRRAAVHHMANVLFNVMRGGVFLQDHRVAVADVRAFIERRNREVAQRFTVDDGTLEIADLRAAVAHDAHLRRLVDEYLPLSFSRRHGDPSRPWNTFEISVRTDSGEPTTGYQGNWRDIFQNWDALLHSFPEYCESVVAKFLNASTVDGHNPYRVTDRGIDWEMPEEGSWGNFGYWGDHQIAYLLRLLDAAERFHPGSVGGALADVAYSYADVPYRIRPYPDLVADPKDTMVFDVDRQQAVEERVTKTGADGRLVPGGDGVHLASLAEKLLVPALAKLSNFVAGGGIWMNTQRPEWNDANNALVGNGVSMVTLFYLRDYLAFLADLLRSTSVEEVPVADRVMTWLESVEQAFADHDVSAAADPPTRRLLLDAAGRAFSDYRAEAYDSGPGTPITVGIVRLQSFLEAVRPHLDRAAEAARRPDGLVESYLIMRLAPGTADLEPLGEMLEGQAAALAGSDATVAGAVGMVDALFASDLYRPDQHSFVLYPDRRPPAFVDKNVVADRVLGAAAALVDGPGGILRRDADGVVRFSSRFRSARELATALDEIDVDDVTRRQALAAYEAVFRHARFTGRSGTMYRYEGLGSIYWHMVSKLLFSLQEQVLAAVAAGEAGPEVRELAERYRRVRAGLGFNKSVAEQGSFPTDPHSHTPAHTGAQQPGMTGQVKEGVLLRWGELGVRVEGGTVRFHPVLLSPAEFLAEARSWPVLGDGGELAPGTLGFTYCGVPIVYHATDGDAWSEVAWSDGRTEKGNGELDSATSRALFARRGEISRIDVGVPSASLLLGR